MRKRSIAVVVSFLLLSASLGFADAPPAPAPTQAPVRKRSRATAFIVAGSLITAAGFVIVGLWGALAASPRTTGDTAEGLGRFLADGVFAATGGVTFGIGVPLLSIGIAEKVAERRAETVNVAIRF